VHGESRNWYINILGIYLVRVRRRKIFCGDVNLILLGNITSLLRDFVVKVMHFGNQL
jgi:hypothetical protein